MAVPQQALTRQELDQAVVPTLGTSPDQFRGSFRQAKDILGQQNDPNIDPNQVVGAAHDLGRAFVTAYYNKTGKLPDPDTLKSFLGSNLNSSYAQKVITGEANEGYRQNLANQMVATDPNIQNNEDQNVQNKNALTQANQSLSDYMTNALKLGQQNIQQDYQNQRGRLVDEAAASGALRQPNFQQPLGQLEITRGKSMGDLISNLAATQGQLGFGAAQRANEFGQTMGLQNRQFGLQNREFNANQSNYQDALNYQRMQDRLNQQTALKLGQMQADASKPGMLDYIGTAFGGVNALANTKNAFFPSKK